MRQGGLAPSKQKGWGFDRQLPQVTISWTITRKTAPFRCEQNISRQKIWTFYDIYLHLLICYLHLSICSGLLHVLYIIGTDRMSTCIRIIPVSKWDLSLACTCMSKLHLVYADIVFTIEHMKIYNFLWKWQILDNL